MDTFYSWLDQLMDVVIVSILVLTFSLPLFTIIPSFAAGIKVFQLKAEGRADSIFLLFFQSFKKGFLKGSLAQLVLVVFYSIGLVNFDIAQNSGPVIGLAVFTLTAFFLFVLTLTVMNWMFVLQDKDVPIKTVLRESMLLSFIKLPQMLLLLVAYGLLAAITVFFPYLLILTLGLIVKTHYKTCSKTWKTISLAPVNI